MNGRFLFSVPAADPILKDVLLQSADAARGKVGFCDEHGAGVYYKYSTAPAQEQGARLAAMRRRRFDFSQPMG